MKSKKTQYMTSMALFLAIEIILVVTPLGYIPIGPLNATTMHIPVIIAGIVLGKKAGAELGFVFGLTSLIKATIQPGITSFCFPICDNRHNVRKLQKSFDCFCS